MSSAYFCPLVTKPVVVVAAGHYVTRCGEVVTVSQVSTKHDFGCRGRYGNGTVEGWHKSGRIFAGIETANDIVGPAPGEDLARVPGYSAGE
ncbi:hypothetical protein J2W32_006451 [Variovorax boronicumulans]|uniref:Uncharacterized protein n=1 Tax=Variovorax boronicumulans TaxID=436515 RepID=A0AAW8D8R4_9BURK|nr:hypothetical protein [Variovorax boronicumulans]MDP9897392.1 hypothetical protein [Variovorax boronicumulans]MDQ0057374.1 hypothetical protein [Variovorax boronicumulans]